MSDGPTQRRAPADLERLRSSLTSAAAVLAGAGAAEADVRRQALEHVEAARAALARLVASGALPAERLGEPPTDVPALASRTVVTPGGDAVRTARGFCLSCLRAWDVPTPVANAALDVANELVANAVRHTSTEVVLELELDAAHVTVRVWDDSPAPPRLLPYRPGVSEHGLGLHLVQQLSVDWGYVTQAEGKWLWATLPRGPRPPGSHLPPVPYMRRSPS